MGSKIAPVAGAAEERAQSTQHWIAAEPGQ